MAGLRMFVFSAVLCGVLGALSAGCFDESDACRAYCEKAAECLDCGGNISLDQCQNQCLDLSIDEKKALGDCATDCPNIYACRDLTGFQPPTPCVY